MDFSAVLILPYSILVAIAVLLGSLITRRARSRLVWPFSFSWITASAAFMGIPQAREIGVWIASVIGLALWAAFGTAIGAGIVGLSKVLIRAFRGK